MLDTTNLLWYGSIAVELLFCLYLDLDEARRSYPIFTVCLGCSVARALRRDLLYARRRRARAFLFATLTSGFGLSPSGCSCRSRVALEVHTKMWKEHGEVLRKTRPLLLFALVTALTAAAIPLRSETIHARRLPGWSCDAFRNSATRYISSVLAIFLVLSAILFFVVVGNGEPATCSGTKECMAAYFAIYAIAAFLIDTGWVIAIW